MSNPAPHKSFVTGVSAILALLTWFALGLQFYLSMVAYLANGRTIGGALVEFFSYFTIECNILTACGLTAVALFGFDKWFFAKAGVLTAFAVYISIVCLVYNVALRGIANPTGWARVADELLHAICPPLFVLFWLIFVPKQSVNYKGALPWLWFPFLYMVYTLVRGAISGLYPYFFMNASNYGYANVALNCAILIGVFLAFDMLFVWVARLLAKRKAL